MRHAKKNQKQVQSCAKKNGVCLTVIKIVNRGVYVRTDAMTRLSRQMDDLTRTYQRAQRKVVDEAISVALTYTPVLEAASTILSELDVFLSLAKVAVHSPGGMYCKPKILEKGSDLILKRARHPCVELQDLPSGGEFIANDYVMTRNDENEKGEGRFMIVTGPNMGGKSTYIRQIGTWFLFEQYCNSQFLLHAFDEHRYNRSSRTDG